MGTCGQGSTNSAELSIVATLTAPYGGIWHVGLKKIDRSEERRVGKEC